VRHGTPPRERKWAILHAAISEPLLRGPVLKGPHDVRVVGHGHLAAGIVLGDRKSLRPGNDLRSRTRHPRLGSEGLVDVLLLRLA